MVLELLLDVLGGGDEQATRTLGGPEEAKRSQELREGQEEPGAKSLEEPAGGLQKPYTNATGAKGTEGSATTGAEREGGGKRGALVAS